jgi:putative FmdB family regulatory protein
VEKIQKFSDPPVTICENCGGKLQRLLSSPAIRFKGSGWYVNDYAKKSSDASGGSSADSSPTAEKKGKEKGTDSSKPIEPAKTSSTKD